MDIAYKLMIMPSSIASKIYPFFVDLEVYDVPFFSYGTEDQKGRKSGRDSSERRFRAEVVGSPEKHVDRVDVGVPLHSGSESRDLVLSHFDHFLAFRRAAREKRRK